MQKRFALFLIGCIGTRFLLTYLAKTVPLTYLPILGYLAVIPAFGFLIIYVMGWRTTGREVFGDKIWWNSLRPVHGILWMLFAILAIRKNQNAWIILLIDTLIGLVAFLVHHFTAGNFKKLM